MNGRTTKKRRQVAAIPSDDDVANELAHRWGWSRPSQSVIYEVTCGGRVTVMSTFSQGQPYSSGGEVLGRKTNVVAQIVASKLRVVICMWERGTTYSGLPAVGFKQSKHRTIVLGMSQENFTT
ncbi:hypothetical protein RB195_001747 [Necator americanus]|uniref:Uncharacterized protein n=1 Tax=Necator americanus TaxID=51031 RepID=A0ABR1DH87_NECAM